MEWKDGGKEVETPLRCPFFRSFFNLFSVVAGWGGGREGRWALLRCTLDIRHPCSLLPYTSPIRRFFFPGGVGVVVVFVVALVATSVRKKTSFCGPHVDEAFFSGVSYQIFFT